MDKLIAAIKAGGINWLQRGWFILIDILLIGFWIRAAKYTRGYTWEWDGRGYLLGILFITLIGVVAYIADRKKDKQKREQNNGSGNV